MTGAEVAADLTDRIRRGDYKPGDKLPYARELAEMYDISVATAQRVYSLLQERGIVVGRQGKGVYVAAR
jgi:DNA-binding GntR family transcriptional regulator